MSTLLRPLAGFVPTQAFGSRLVGPPTSMLSPSQRDAARRDPWSFRHSVGRAAGVSDVAAHEWVERAREQHVLDAVGPAVFVYRQIEKGVAVTGIIGDVSLDAYDSGLVKRHESTVAKTQKRMADYMRTSRIQGNAVALTHRPNAGVSSFIAAQTTRRPDTSFATADGLTHQLWVATGRDAEELCRGFRDTLYVTDGHHRLAAAAAVASEEGIDGARFPAGVFPSDRMRLRAFARCITGVDGLDSTAIVSALGAKHHLEEVTAAEARPQQRLEFGVRIYDRYFLLRIDPANVPEDPYASLDVNVLQDLVLGPFFGIAKHRRDTRLRSVADLIDSGHPDVDAEASFLPFPVSIDDVMAVADSGKVMPPKSTWFAPKIPSGLFIRMLDEA